MSDLQEIVREYHRKKMAGQEIKPLALKYRSGHSNTTRSKSYKKLCHHLDVGSLDQIVHIDTEKQIAIVEPRVTMERLVQATLAHGLIPKVVPEFKGITVGGAIMGAAAESSSHLFGIFSDCCRSYDMLLGNGELLRATSCENSDIFNAIAGSYGSLGMLTKAEITLTPAQKFVHLKYHVFTQLEEAISFMRNTIHNYAPTFFDGIAFSKNHIVIISGELVSQASSLPLWQSSQWYYQHVKEVPPSYEELMPIQNYLFRYDEGAFWMGSYLLKPFLLSQFLIQGICNMMPSRKEGFSQKDILNFHKVKGPHPFLAALIRPFMASQTLWKLLHKAEKWVQEHFLIQDFCIPESLALSFLQDTVADPGTFPLWLCPIKSTSQSQIFSPHLSEKEHFFINVGMYGLPSYSQKIDLITTKLEKKTHMLQGRKVLYSRSYYSEEEFWKIYSKSQYEKLREKMHAVGVWQDITEKVLSI